MSILSWFLKPKQEMAKPHTRHVRVGKYKVTSHAQNKTVDPTRNLKKKDMIINLLGKTSKNSKIIHTPTEQYSTIGLMTIIELLPASQKRKKG